MKQSSAAPSEQIAQHGDALDIAGRLGRGQALLTYGALSASVFMGTFGSEVAFLRPQDAVPCVIYSVPFLTTAAVVNGLSRHRSSKKQEQSARYQAEIRGELNESVDYFRAPERRGGDLLRWYGLDLADEPADEAGRLNKIIDYMEQHDIPRVAFSARRLGLPEGSSEFGVLKDGKSVISDAKRNLKHTVGALSLFDDRLDDEMVICTIEQAKKVAEKLHSEQDSTLLARLIHIAGIPELSAALNRMHTGETSKLALRNATQRKIIQHLDGEMPLDFVVKEERDGRQRGIQTSTFTITGGVVHISGNARYREGLPPQSNWAASQSIPAFCQAETKEALIERALSEEQGRTPEERRKDALFAIYVHLLDDAEQVDQPPTASTGHVSTGSHHTPPPTTLELLPGERGVRAGKTGDPDVYLYRTGRKIERGVLKVAGGIIALAVGAGAQSGLTAAWNTVYENVTAACDTTAQEWQAAHPDALSPYDDRTGYGLCDNDALLAATLDGDQGLQVQAAFEGVLSDIYDAGTKFQAGIASAALRLGIQPPKAWSDEVLDSPLLGDAAGYIQVPPSALIGRSDNPGIGDVPPTFNQELYHITPLTGKSPSGYWYTGIYDEARLQDRPGTVDVDNPKITIGYGSSEVAKPDAVRLDSTPEAIEAMTPDFAVLTSVLRNWGDSTNLPRLDGYSVVAVQLVDESNPAIVIPIDTVTHYPDTSSYSVTVRQQYTDEFDQQGGTQPRLRYYLKESSETGKAVRRFTLTDGSYRVATGSVEASTKTGLGLPKNATDKQVEEAISGKFYSFTPFEGSGVKPYIQPSDGELPETMYEELGRQLGSMPEMNCNVAATTLLLATGGENGSLNAAVGFHNNDDNSLASLEAHQWTVDTAGTIHDATPSTPAPDSPQPPSEIDSMAQQNNPLPIVPVGLIAAGGLAALAAHRRRRQIAWAARTAHAFAATSGRSTREALEVLNQIQYMDEGSVVDIRLPASAAQTGHWRDTARQLTAPVRPLPSWREAQAIARRRGTDTSGVRGRTKFKINLLHRARGSIEEVGNR